MIKNRLESRFWGIHCGVLFLSIAGHRRIPAGNQNIDWYFLRCYDTLTTG